MEGYSKVDGTDLLTSINLQDCFYKRIVGQKNSSSDPNQNQDMSLQLNSMESKESSAHTCSLIFFYLSVQMHPGFWRLFKMEEFRNSKVSGQEIRTRQKNLIFKDIKQGGDLCLDHLFNISQPEDLSLLYLQNYPILAYYFCVQIKHSFRD